MGERTKGHTVEQTIVYFHSKKFCFLLRFQTSWVRLTLNIRTDSSPSNNPLPPPGIDPRGTTLKNQLYTPSHMSNIGLKCFSDQDLSICLDRFNLVVKFFEDKSTHHHQFHEKNTSRFNPIYNSYCCCK